MSRDFQRSAVYGSEHRLQWFYDHASAAAVTIGGVPLQLEPERSFDSLEAIQAYVSRIALHPGVIGRFGMVGTVKVRERKDEGKAHYQPRNATIAINTTMSGWAMRELVILHELAHHYQPRGFDKAAHGPEFVTTEIDLVSIVLGPQAGLALRILFDAESVSAK